MKETIYVIWRSNNKPFGGGSESSALLSCKSKKLAEIYVRRITAWLKGIPKPRLYDGTTYTKASFDFSLMPLLGEKYDQIMAVYDLEGLKMAKKNDRSATILYIEEMELHDET